MPTFHFNRRDVSFRHNLLVLSNQDDLRGTLVTRERRNIPFESIRLVLDEVVVTDAENRASMGLNEVEMVIVEVE